MQTPRLRPKNLKKKKKSGVPANSPMPKPRPRNLATKKEKDALDSGFRIQEMEGREREAMKKMKRGGALKTVPAGNKGLAKLPTGVRNNMGYMKSGGKVKKMGMGGKCRGMGKAMQGGNYSKMG